MVGELEQKSLFKSESTINNNPLFEVEESLPYKITPNLSVAFGVTKKGLLEGNYRTLENIFYGINNLGIPIEMLVIENPDEILANYFAAGKLKRHNRHLSLNLPHDFLPLINALNKHSYPDGFASLAHNFRNYFNKNPGKQKERLSILEKTTKDEFIASFFSPYKFSNKDVEFNHDFYDPNFDGRDKGIYVNKIYEKFLSLSQEVKEI